MSCTAYSRYFCPRRGFSQSNWRESGLLSLIFQRRVRLIASAVLYFEYEMVLKRPSQIDVHGFSIADVDRFLLLLAGFTDTVDIYHNWRPQLSDPDDELVLEAAINGHAAAIVPHNIRDFLPAATQVGIQVATPGVILRERFSHE